MKGRKRRPEPVEGSKVKGRGIKKVPNLSVSGLWISPFSLKPWQVPRMRA
jgi:hypothetical protein